MGTSQIQGDAVSKLLEEHAALKSQLEEVKLNTQAEFAVFTNLHATRTHALLLKEKLMNPKVAKKGGVQCGTLKGKDTDPCTSPGHLTSGLFCGTHKAHATSVAFATVMQCMNATSLGSLIATFGAGTEREEAVETLDELAGKKKNELNETELRRNALEKTLKEIEEKEKVQRLALKQLRGPRVTKLYEILEVDIGVRFSHRSGEFGMTGNECRKFLRQYEDVLAVVADQADLHAKYAGLFGRFSEIVGLLYRTSPFSTLGHYPGEEDLLQGKVPAQPLQLPEREGPSEVDQIAEKFRDLQSFYVQNFPNIPTPKQHMLAFHAPRFIQTWLSLGMFSEQAVESIHAIFNGGRRRYRSLGAEGAERKAIHRLNQMYMANPKSFKNKGRIGKRRNRGPRRPQVLKRPKVLRRAQVIRLTQVLRRTR